MRFSIHLVVVQPPNYTSPGILDQSNRKKTKLFSIIVMVKCLLVDSFRLSNWLAYRHFITLKSLIIENDWFGLKVWPFNQHFSYFKYTFTICINSAFSQKQKIFRVHKIYKVNRITSTPNFSESFASIYHNNMFSFRQNLFVKHNQDD